MSWVLRYYSWQPKRLFKVILGAWRQSKTLFHWFWTNGMIQIDEWQKESKMSQLLFCFCQEEMQIRRQKVKLTLIRKNCCPRWANRPKKKDSSALNNIFPAFNDSAFKAYKQTALTEHVLCVRDTHRHWVFTSSALWLMIEQDGGGGVIKS